MTGVINSRGFTLQTPTDVSVSNKKAIREYKNKKHTQLHILLPLLLTKYIFFLFLKHIFFLKFDKNTKKKK